MNILNDRSKFVCLGPVPEFGRTADVEQSIRAYLKELKEACEILKSVYDRVYPLGSVRPRMYGLPKTGLEKSAAIRPFATKKSRLASEKILLADSLATESCRLANRLATKLFGGQRRCGPSLVAQGAWQSLSVQYARDLAV